MDDLFHLVQRLQHYKETNPDLGKEHFEIGRHTYCHLMVKHQGKWHKFEVRQFRVTMDYGMIEIAAVNWTLAAGSCTLSIQRENNINDFKILEDEPTMQVLYE